MAKKKVEGMVGIQLTPFKANGEEDEEIHSRRYHKSCLHSYRRSVLSRQTTVVPAFDLRVISR